LLAPPDTFTAAVGAGIASSKTYGSLSVFTQLHCDVRLAFRVPPGAFRPPPKVDSGVLHLRVLREPRVRLADVPRFEKVVRAAFAQRRKMLANALGGGRGLPLDVVRRAAAAAGVDPTSLRKGGGLVDAPGRWLVGPKGEFPLRAPIPLRPDGRGLRQLTDARGRTINADGSFGVELPGPFAYSSGPR
jgi:Ribosomal RNA adenine dimethylase